jgi:hypothetical protein
MTKLTINAASQRLIELTIQQLPNALVISGQSGVGVTAIAKHIAKSVGSPELIITPKKRLQNGAKLVEDFENGSIVIEDIRQLYTQTRSKFVSPQVFIIDFANRQMTLQAQNAFLKLLEEPQANIYFILATHHPEQLLPTVLSRSQRIDIAPLSSTQTTEFLDSLQINDSTRRTRIEFIAKGLPAEMYRLAKNDEYYQDRITTVQDARTILEGSSYQRMLTIRQYKDQRVKALLLIDDIMQQLTLAIKRSPQPAVIAQIDSLVSAYERIQANGNIQLQLTKVLL